MRRTESGIDEFKLKWYLYSGRDESTGRSIDYRRRLIREKAPDEPLTEFFKENKKGEDYRIFLRYFINGVDFAFWYNLNYSISHLLGEDGGLISSFRLFGFNTAAGKIQTHRLKGNKLDLAFWKTLSLDEVSYSPEGIKKLEEYFEEENKDIQLYGCGICGDRDCGYFPLHIERKGKLIEWKIPHTYLRTFRFDYEEYAKEFEELEALPLYYPNFRNTDNRVLYS